MFTADETRACLAGKWVMIFGGSNAYSMIGGVLGLITQAPYDFPRREWLNCTYCDEWSGAPTIIDMIVAQNGTVVYSGVPTWDGVWSPEAWQYDPGLDPTREAMMHKILDEAPLPSPEDVRITWMYTRFFTAVHLQTLSAWSRVPFMPAPEVHVNIGVWYSACTWGWGGSPCSEYAAIYEQDGGYLNTFRRNYVGMLDAFRTQSPEINVLIRNQAYYNPVEELPIFMEEFLAQPTPHNLTLLNWDFVGPDWSYVFEFPGVTVHPAHLGSQLLFNQHLNFICPIPPVPIAASVGRWPQHAPCYGDASHDYYVGVLEPGCWPQGTYHELGDNLPPPCRSGTASAHVWNPYTLLYSGDCVTLSCPPNALGAPDCFCQVGYRSSIYWDAGAQAWGGGCTQVACPVHARLLAGACECDAGYAGNIYWSYYGSVWRGACLPMPCPLHATGSPDFCECNLGYTGSISWNYEFRAWASICFDALYPERTTRTSISHNRLRLQVPCLRAQQPGV